MSGKRRVRSLPGRLYSFTRGPSLRAMKPSRLVAMKAARDEANHRSGRDLVVLKAAVVDSEIEKLGLKLRMVERASRMVSPMAYAISPAYRGLSELIRMTRAAATKNGVQKPVWITEVGYTTDTIVVCWQQRHINLDCPCLPRHP